MREQKIEIRVQCHKNLYRMFIISYSVCPWPAFAPQSNGCVKAGAYPSEVPFRVGILALPTDIRLGCKGLPGTNTLAYYENQ
jgi:hypothetical protein